MTLAACSAGRWSLLCWTAPASSGQRSAGDKRPDPFAKYILSLPADVRPKTYAVVSQDDPFALGVVERMKALLTAYGKIKLVLDEVYPADLTDFRAIATKIAALNPDLIVGGTILEASIAQTRAYREGGDPPRRAV